MTVAFFDLDRTLLEVNSGKLWFQRERAAGRLALHQALEAVGWMGLYALGLMDGQIALGRAARVVEGTPEAVLDERVRTFYDEDLRGAFAPGGLAAVRAHQEAGDRVVLLTSASIYVARCVQDHLGLDDVLSLELEVANGVFTGGIRRYCFGSGKVVCAREWADERDVDLSSCWFYTDSITDLPMLEVVGRPMAVHPDPRLARVARRRGWPVLDWRAGAA